MNTLLLMLAFIAAGLAVCIFVLFAFGLPTLKAHGDYIVYGVIGVYIVFRFMQMRS